MGPERRISARCILYSPEYLDMGADNGGVVVDLSEGGLRFQAVGRVEAESDLSLSFSLGTGYRIDVLGRIAWISPRGNSGGIAFKNLSSDSRSLIREWLAKPEAERRAESLISTTDSEELREGEGGENPSGGLNPVKLERAQAGGTPKDEGIASPGQATGDPSFGELQQEARIEEISAPDEIPLEGARLPRELFAANPSTINASPSAPPSAAPEKESPASASAATPSRVANPQVREFKPIERKTSAPAVTPLRGGVPPVARAPNVANSASPQNFPPHAGQSFSVAPSISTWAGKEVFPPSTPRRSNSLAADLGFPPQSTKNIFARGRWTPPELEPESEPHNRKAVLFFAILCILTAVALVLFAYTSMHRQQIGSVIQRMGSTLAGKSNAPQSANSAKDSAVPRSNNTAAPSGASTRSANPPPTPTSQALPAKAPALTAKITSNSPAVADSEAQQSAPKGAGSSQRVQANSLSAAAQETAMAQAEFIRAQKYLMGAGVLPDPATAAEWFWRSLEAGDTDAALPLADLYLRGEGVSQNCTQAKILLDTAARKGNAEAERRLQELPVNCE